MDRFEQIKKKLNEKGLEYNPPLSLEEVEKFEKKNGFTLPDEYRNFLLKVGNGGEMIDGFDLWQLEGLEIDRETINVKFPLTDCWVWEDEDADEEEIRKVSNGNFELIEVEGEGATWNLIVTGECAGEMWFFTSFGVQPTVPRRGFLDWFEFWLDGNGGEDYFFDQD